MRPARHVLLIACLLLLLLLPAAPVRAQFEAGTDEISEDARLAAYPTIEAIRQARRAGHPVERILRWIREFDAVFPLDLDEAAQLHAEGVETAIIATMAKMPIEQVDSLFRTLDSVYVARPGPREGLSRRHLLKMMKFGAPEEEVLRTIAEQGSRAELTLKEAVEMLEGGASPRLVVAIGRGIVPPEAIHPGGAGDAPFLDDLLDVEGGDEPPASLEEIFEEEGLVEPEHGAPRLVVLSDPPGSRIFLAPGAIRPADMTELPRAEGRTPAAVQAQPGAWWVLVEKQLNDFDAAIVPALRTVHDSEGGTRTLIHNGTFYYDVEDCCIPHGLSGPVEITRIGENRPGFMLGDEFDGMPPYLWDGNRYLVIRVEEGHIKRILKVYAVRRAAGEERTVAATFIPSTADPLRHPASLESVSTRARATWEDPGEEELAGIARISGIPEGHVQAIRDRLHETGKALWKVESDGGVKILSFGLQTLGRLSLHRVELQRTGMFGMLSTPGKGLPAAATKAAANGSVPPTAEREPAPLPAVRRTRAPELELPIFEITNEGAHAAMASLDDGTAIYVPPGGKVETVVAPGTSWIQVRFDAEGSRILLGRSLFSYHARYSLILN
jgi:hypothetical protein